MDMEIRTCPMCGKQYNGYPAISRTMGREEICPECGTSQALNSLALMTAPCYQTRGIAEWAGDDAEVISFVCQCYNRHTHLDWGDMDKEDLHMNDTSLSNGNRLFSSYTIPEHIQTSLTGDKIWIITEWDRSATTILFPDEY